MRRELKIAALCGLVLCGFLLWPRISTSAQATSPTLKLRSAPRPKQPDDDFWREARVPETDRFREPSCAAPTTVALQQADPEKQIEELLAKGDSNGVTVALVDWFSTHPKDARDWLETKESLGFCQPALRMVAVSFATRGDCDLALEWTALLESPAQRDEAVARIYSTGFVSGRFSSEDLAAAPLADETRRAILEGKAND